MFNVIKSRKITFGISIVLVVLSIAFLIINGLNWDIDFTGGTTMTIEIGQEFDNNEVADIVNNAVGFPASAVQKSGDAGTEVVIKISAPLDRGTSSIESEERAKIFSALQERYSLPDEALLSSDNVNATVGKELQSSAIWATVIAILLMLVYISFRFELQSGLCAVITLAQNVIIVVGVYAAFKIPVNLTFVAAILTIVGYSINDTIVIFDRIRENNRIMKKTPFSEIVDKSVWQSFTRSINTSVTTLLTIVILFFVGVESLKAFTLPIIIGILVGTYSSIFVASPLWAAIRGDGKYAQKNA